MAKKKKVVKTEKTIVEPQTLCAGCMASPVTYRTNDGVGFCCLACETNYQ